jgi:hypothetical protein
MTPNRRSFLGTLFAAPLTKLGWSKPSNIGRKPLMAHVSDLGEWPIGRPFPTPRLYVRRHTDVLTMAELQVLCNPDLPWWIKPGHSPVICADKAAYREIWNNIAPMDRYVVMESDLAKRGFMSFKLFGAEVVLDYGLKANEVWYIDPKQPDCLWLNTLLTYRAIDIRPRPYTSPTDEEVAEWGEEFEPYDQD